MGYRVGGDCGDGLVESEDIREVHVKGGNVT